MEANFVKKIGEFTPEFLDGISKVFSANATLHIKVEYGEAEVVAPKAAAKVAKPKAVTAVVETPKKRGRKAGSKSKAASVEAPKEKGAESTSTSDEGAPKKRGRQPGFKPKAKAAVSTEGPKKRGPKPKAPVEA